MTNKSARLAFCSTPAHSSIAIVDEIYSNVDRDCSIGALVKKD
jgi:hypothetical protein